MKKVLLTITEELHACLFAMAEARGIGVNELIEERLRVDRLVKAAAAEQSITFQTRISRGRPKKLEGK